MAKQTEEKDIKDLISTLIKNRDKLIITLQQSPINNDQRKAIKKGKELLEQLNDIIEYFCV